MANLAIDIGNTNTHLAVFSKKKCARTLVFSTAAGREAESLLLRCLGNLKNEIVYAGISSVQPGMNKYWFRACKHILKLDPLIISHRTKLPLNLSVKSPKTLGSDRICNAVCGFSLRKKMNILVVSLGTAITIDVILKDGRFVGGIIAAGISTSAKALHEFTGKLPRLKPKELKFNSEVIGRDTNSAMSSGLVNFSAYAVERYILEIERKYKTNFKVVLTGGDASKIRKHLKRKNSYVENTVLEGINQILVFQSV